MKRQVQISALAFLLTLLASCATFGVPTATKFGERLAGGYTTVTTIRSTNIAMVNADAIGSKDAQNIKEQADVARAGLDIARDIRATDPAGANEKLDSTLLILQALQRYVNSKKPTTTRSAP